MTVIENMKIQAIKKCETFRKKGISYFYFRFLQLYQSEKKNQKNKYKPLHSFYFYFFLNCVLLKKKTLVVLLTQTNKI